MVVYAEIIYWEITFAKAEQSDFDQIINVAQNEPQCPFSTSCRPFTFVFIDLFIFYIE